MNNPWVQGIVCSLIAALLYDLIKKLCRIDYPTTTLLISVAVATVVFAFGQVLEPATRVLLEGNWAVWPLIMRFREEAPGLFVLALFLGGLLPGIVTGLMVVKGSSLNHRLKYAAFWAPVSLTFFDAVYYFLSWQLVIPEKTRYLLINWGDVAFSLVSNIVGGVAGGMIIGILVHFFVERGLTINPKSRINSDAP